MNTTESVTFTYDASGNLTGYDDGVTSAVYAYDAASRKIAETVNVGPFSKTIRYTYYPATYLLQILFTCLYLKRICIKELP